MGGEYGQAFLNICGGGVKKTPSEEGEKLRVF
jgi:hypothetical protein